MKKEVVEEVKEEQVEKTTDAIMSEDERKMAEWTFLYDEKVKKEHEDLQMILDTYKFFPEWISKYDTVERVLYLLSEVYRLTGEVKGLKARG